jgi:hypothetical protein
MASEAVEPLYSGADTITGIASRRAHWLTPERFAAVVAATAATLMLLAGLGYGLGLFISFDEAYNLALAKHFAATGQ